MQILKTIVCLYVLMFSASVFAELPTMHIAVPNNSSLNWEIQTIKIFGLDKIEGFNLELQAVTTKEEAQASLVAGHVDAILEDWVWVSRKRGEGHNFTYIPYEHTNGDMIVKNTGDIQSLSDLKGKRVGIVGDGFNKSWLLFVKLAENRYNLNLNKVCDRIFGEAAHLNAKMQEGELDVIVNYWQYATKLEAQGFRRLLNAKDALEALEINPDLPMDGYVFNLETLASQELIVSMTRVSRQAKAILASNKSTWEQLRPFMMAKTQKTFELLKKRFRDGIPLRWSDNEKKAAAYYFKLLADIGGDDLVGPSRSITEGTFFHDVSY